MISLLLRILKTKKLYFYIGGIVFAMILAGRVGYSLAEGKYNAEKIDALKNYIAESERIQQENREIDEAVYQDLLEKKEKTKIIKQKVIEYVKQDTDLSKCTISSYGLQLWNGEIPKDISK